MHTGVSLSPLFYIFLSVYLYDHWQWKTPLVDNLSPQFTVLFHLNEILPIVPVTSHLWKCSLSESLFVVILHPTAAPEDTSYKCTQARVFFISPLIFNFSNIARHKGYSLKCRVSVTVKLKVLHHLWIWAESWGPRCSRGQQRDFRDSWPDEIK